MPRLHFKTHRLLIITISLMLFALLNSANSFAEGLTTEQRLQRLEDKEAIRALLERFFEYQETGNTEGFANTFAQDGEMYLRVGHTTGGPKGILASMSRGRNDDSGARANAAGSSGEGSRQSRQMHHVLSNVYIELNGDTATAKSRWTMLVMEDRNRARLGGTGTYCDKLVRENGEWKFQQRVIYCEIPDYDKIKAERAARQRQNGQ